MFGTGPLLTHDARVFLSLLEKHTDIELLGAFCEADSPTAMSFVRDLWRRRGWLAVPLLAAWILSGIIRYASHPGSELALRRHMQRLSSRIHFVPDIHAPEVIEHVKSWTPDLGLIYGSPILRPSLFETPVLGTLGIHHGSAPKYRGNKTTFWEMYNGEATAGVIIQKINAGLDTGQIVKEGSVAIGNRTRGSVWRELEALGLKLYIQAILEVKNGSAVYRPQTGQKGKLYRNPTLHDLLRFWVMQVTRKLKRS